MSTGPSSKEAHDLPKKVPKELITPYKLTIAILIKCYCQCKESGEFQIMTTSDKLLLQKSFCIIALKVLHGPDLGLIEIRNIVAAAPALSTIPIQFGESLKQLHLNGVGKLLDVIEELKLIVNGEPSQLDKSSVASGTVLTKTGCIGHFLRRFIVFFEKLTFSEVSILHAAYTIYYEEGIALAQCGSSAANLNRHKWEDKPWSRRQAELFLCTQAALYENDESRALNPQELQAKITSMLKSNPDLAEAHFMSFLNYLKVNDICGAMKTLFHCFDRRTNPDVKVFNDDKSKEHRYAALNLAILHHHFGHTAEAVACLKEAIKIAHEANDLLCLQHALSWLYRFSNVNKDNLIIQCIIKTFELNISYTTSLALQDFAQYGSVKTAVKPKVLFKTLSKSDVLNSQHSFKDLIFSNNAMKSSLWRLYGKTLLCSLWAHELLNLNTFLPQTSAYYGEGYLQSVCNVALHLLAEGEYALTNTILQYMKTKYPHEPLARNWMLVENWSHYTLALYHQRYSVAEEVAQKIKVLDKWEGLLKMAEVNLYRGEFTRAHAIVGVILKHYNRDEHLNDGKYCLLRAKLLQAEIYYTSNSSAVGVAETLLETCLMEATTSGLAYLIALIHLHISHSFLAQSMQTQALRNLKQRKCMTEIMGNGSLYDRARANQLYIRIKILNSDKSQEESYRKTLLQAVNDLETVKNDFKKLEANARVKNVLNIQAHLYNALKMDTERNNCAFECQRLDLSFAERPASKLLRYL
ncbi:anaphase-promoting complex subunit 5 isoform X1 [Dendroctonus ponderosae]|uniref:anaphase-promoting complex subunit 5 isoform X1 n=2 Tax=Dendroctonus ponderosae TaxID=77166 RepID=UPI002035DC7E|nr:anaphase-promoting complex subunit 5 isoform X1 [Dendroctonus ponderosae]